MTADLWALAIDFGTSRSAGAMAADAAVTPLEVEGNRWIASLVLLAPDGQVVVGAAAENLAGVHPERIERTPKRRLGGAAPLLLGDATVEVPRAVAAVLAVFLAEGRLRRGGDDPAASVLTHPVRWEETRKSALLEAAGLAGLREPALIEEPVAAAVHYVSDQVAPGGHVGVYDLGGGTFDTAVLRRTDDGFEVVGPPGGDEHIGGEVFDHRLFTYFGECLAQDDAELWDQILTGDERKWKRAASDLLAQARRAKEALSSYTQTQVFVPVADRDIVVNRSQFEAMIVDDIERSVDLMEDTIEGAGLGVDDIAAIYLVGGSSRLPLVTQLMRERFGDRVATRDEPKSVVVLGAAAVAAGRLRSGAASLPLDALPTPRAEERLDALPTPRAEERLDALAPPRADERLDVAEVAPVAPVEVAVEAPAAVGLQTGGGPAAVAPAASAAVPVDGGPGAMATAPPLVLHGDALPLNLAWRVQLERLPGLIASDATTAYFGTEDARFHAVDLVSGTERFVVTLGGVVYGAAAAGGGRVYAAGFDGSVTALDGATGVTAWQAPTGGPIASGPALQDDVVYAGNDAGDLVALDASTGELRWRLPIGHPLRAGLLPVDGTVVAGSLDGTVFAVDPGAGTVRWAYPTGGSVTGTPARVGDAVLVPSGDGLLYCLDLASGRPRWAFRSGGPLVTPVAVDGSVAFVASGGEDGGVYAVDATTGDGLWRYGAGPYSSGPVACGGALYIDTGSGELLGFDVASATLRLQVGTGQYNRSRPALAGRLVLVATTFAQVYALVAPPT